MRGAERRAQESDDPHGIGSGLQLVLHEWLVRQPWMDGVGARVADVRIERIDVLEVGPPTLAWVVLAVSDRSGGVDLVQQFVMIGDHVPDRVPDDGILGPIPGRRDGFVAWSALADPMAALELCRRASPATPMVRVRPAGSDRCAARFAVDAHWHVEFFHRLEDGPNPDVEAATELSGLAPGVVAPIGVWRRNGADLAMVRATRPSMRPAAELAREELARLTGTGVVRLATRAAVQRWGGLGRALGEFHVASAARFGNRAASAEDVQRAGELAAASTPDSAFARISPAIRDATRQLPGADLGRALRVHGNLDLDATFTDGEAWSLDGISGGRGGSVRRWTTPTSPLWDLAGLLDEVERIGRHARDAASRDLEVEVAVESWTDLAGEAIVSGYAAAPGVSPLLPATRSGRDALLTVCGALRSAARTVVAAPVLDVRELAAGAADRPTPASR